MHALCCVEADHCDGRGCIADFDTDTIFSSVTVNVTPNYRWSVCEALWSALYFRLLSRCFGPFIVSSLSSKASALFALACSNSCRINCIAWSPSLHFLTGSFPAQTLFLWCRLELFSLKPQWPPWNGLGNKSWRSPATWADFILSVSVSMHNITRHKWEVCWHFIRIIEQCKLIWNVLFLSKMQTRSMHAVLRRKSWGGW